MCCNEKLKSLGFEALQHQEITSETRCNESLRELEFICQQKPSQLPTGSMCWNEKVESLEPSHLPTSSMCCNEKENLHIFPPPACAAMKNLKVLDLRHCDIQHQEITSETRCNESLRELEFICQQKPSQLPTSSMRWNEKVKSLGFELL
jgi:hypothetical protein